MNQVLCLCSFRQSCNLTVQCSRLVSIFSSLGVQEAFLHLPVLLTPLSLASQTLFLLSLSALLICLSCIPECKGFISGKSLVSPLHKVRLLPTSLEN